MSIRSILLIPLLLGLLRANSVADQALQLPSIFSDHMILQQGRPIPVWGWTEPNKSVAVAFHNQSKTTRSDGTGRWTLHLDAETSSAEPRQLTVTAGETRLIIEDVLVGEVWFCAGQSNMAMTIDGKTAWLHVGGIADAKEVVRNSRDPLLRQFKVAWKTDTRPQDHAQGVWTIAGTDTTAEFSATAYFFARRLREQLKVPVAILNSSFGGSSVEGWTSRDALRKHADPEWVKAMEQLINNHENHDRRVVDHVAQISDWERRTGRQDPRGDADDNDWIERGPEDAAWRSVDLPKTLSKIGCPHGGVIWLRKDIEIPREFGDAWRLDFPSCKAFATIHLNGSPIFWSTAYNQLSGTASRPSIPKGITRPGTNTLLIKLHAHTGKWGFAGGKFGIVPFNPNFPSIDLNGEWSLGIESAFSAPPADATEAPSPPVKGVLHWMPVPSHFNAMVHPFIPYSIKGVIWYQGESNVGKPHYDNHLKILIRDWRERWGQGEFPFYLCLLPGFGPRKVQPVASPWAECREKQLAVLDLPNTGIANLIDTCEDGDLHPIHKTEAGRRLAALALAKTYGINGIPWIHPSFSSASVRDGKVTVHFKGTGNRLLAKPLPETVHPNLRKPETERVPLLLPSPGSEVQGFALCSRQTDATGEQADTWHNAQARIEGDRVIVWSPAVPHPVAIRYAWADHPVCNLMGENESPAFPFQHTLAPSRSQP